MTKPSDRAIAQAFWKACDTVNLDKKALVDLLHRIELDAREIDAAAPEGAQAVAWQVRRTDVPERGWEACTRELYEATLRTGRYAGYDNGPPCEVRTLYTAPPQPQGAEDAAGYYLASFKRKWLGGALLWWGPNDAGYTPDLQQAGVYTELKPGYHDSEDTVPVPVWFVRGGRFRIRHELDPGDSENGAFWNAAKLRAAIDTARAAGGGGE